MHNDPADQSEEEFVAWEEACERAGLGASGSAPDEVCPQCGLAWPDDCKCDWVMPIADERKWRCRRCMAIYMHSECASRFGVVECPSCLRLAFVGLLENVSEAIESSAASQLSASQADQKGDG